MNIFRLTAEARSRLRIFTGRQLIVNHSQVIPGFRSWSFLVVVAKAGPQGDVPRLNLSMINSSYLRNPDS